MKLRPFLVLLLFVASAGILVWLYYTATGKPKPAHESVWTETLADLDACCRRKHVKSAQYEHFAAIADREQRRDAARLFRAMALSERLQENYCAGAIVRLGGNYTPPKRIIVFRGTTENNRARSIDYERRTMDERHGAEIDRAMQLGNRYAARMLIWAAANDLRHVAFMEHCHCTQADSCVYLVCPSCGHLYEATRCDFYCPSCLTSGRKFVRFE